MLRPLKEDPEKPEEYDKILELSSTASASAVQATYRRKMTELRPYRNISKNVWRKLGQRLCPL